DADARLAMLHAESCGTPGAGHRRGDTSIDRGAPSAIKVLMIKHRGTGEYICEASLVRPRKERVTAWILGSTWVMGSEQHGLERHTRSGRLPRGGPQLHRPEPARALSRGCRGLPVAA